MAILTPDKIRTETVNGKTITIKEKIIPSTARATRDLFPNNTPAYAKKGMPMKPNVKLNDGTGVPRGITVHNTNDISTPANTNPAEQYTRATWPNCNMAGVVVHFYVYKNEIWQNLLENERGWHASDGSARRNAKRAGKKIGGNMDTIAIECIGNIAESEKTTQVLIAYLCKKYSFDPDLDIYQHNDFLPTKNCPVYIRPHWDSFIKGVRDILATSTPAPTPTPVKPITPPPASTSARMYDVKSTIPGYMTAEDAKNAKNVKTTIAPGTYYVYKEYGGMLNLSKVSTSPGSWMNPNATSTVSTAIRVGDSVKIIKDRKTYDNKKLISAAYGWTYKVKQINGDRIVITRLGVVIAAMKASDVYKV